MITVKFLRPLTIATLLTIPSTLLGQSASPPTVQTARQLIRQQKFTEAAEILQAIVEREPDNPQAWFSLGVARHSAGDLESALTAHLKATAYQQTAARAMYNAGMAYALMGDKDKAFEWLEKSLATGSLNMTNIAFDSDAETLRDDIRYRALFPTDAEYADPFVEDAVVLQEWRGETQGDQFGWIAKNIGDVDGDGINDVVTSAPSFSGSGRGAGKVYVFSTRTGEELWTVSGQAGWSLGLGLDAAGDVNADGVPDVVAGAPGGDRSFVYSGRDGSILFELAAEQPGEQHGRKVSEIGDANGDGHDDVLIGAPLNDANGRDAGRSYLHSGKDGSLLLTLTGERAGDRFGSAVGGMVWNGEPWLVVGAPNAGPNQGGRTYVYRGLNSEPAFVIEADDSGAQLGGMFVSVLGDVNGDGMPDIYASDWSANANGPGAGRVYIHSGADGSRMTVLSGEARGDGFGIGAADAGDVDGDGHADLVIGAWQHRGAAPSGGKVYLYSGRDFSLLRVWTGQVMGETFGFDATGMGDVDGDGYGDVLLTSAWSAINGARSGRMFVLSGR